jgi:predicted DNA binding CopG/RHH family protein
VSSTSPTRFDMLRKAPTAAATESERVDQFIAGEEATTQISVRLPKSLVRALKIHMAQTTQTQQTILQQLLETYLRDHGAL